MTTVRTAIAVALAAALAGGCGRASGGGAASGSAGGTAGPGGSGAATASGSAHAVASGSADDPPPPPADEPDDDDSKDPLPDPPPWPAYAPPLPARVACKPGCDLSTHAAIARFLGHGQPHLPWVQQPAPGVVIVGAEATDMARVVDAVIVDCCRVGGDVRDAQLETEAARALGWDQADARGRQAIAWLLVSGVEQISVLALDADTGDSPFPDPKLRTAPAARTLADGGVELDFWHHLWSLDLDEYVHVQARIDAGARLTTKDVETLTVDRAAHERLARQRARDAARAAGVAPKAPPSPSPTK